MNYDAYITGYYDPTSPINQIEPEPEEEMTFTEKLENELNKDYFKELLRDFRYTAMQIASVWKRIQEIEQNSSLLPIDSDEQQELIKLKKKLTKFIDTL
jgi:hypothetical protein